MVAVTLRPDVRTYNPMISSCTSWEEAVTILSEMEAREVSPDTKSHSACNPPSVCQPPRPRIVYSNVDFSGLSLRFLA